MTQPLVSVIIVNHNGGKYVIDCIGSVLQTAHYRTEVIVVDNASTDWSMAALEEAFGHDKRIKFLRNLQNLGYAAAINRASIEAGGDYLAVLNNDTAPASNWLDGPLRLMEDDTSLGAVQPVLFYAHSPDVINDAGHFIDKFGTVYSRKVLPANTAGLGSGDEIFAATGAAMIIRRKVFRDLQGFDSDFFLLFEETDFCWRVWLSGFRIIIDPTSIVYHRARASYHRENKVAYLFNRNRLCSMLKNYGTWNALEFIPANVFILLGTGVYSLSRSNPTVLIQNIRAILWNVMNLGRTLQKRRQFDPLRRVPEKRLFESGLIKQPNMTAIFKRLQAIR